MLKYLPVFVLAACAASQPDAYSGIAPDRPSEYYGFEYREADQSWPDNAIEIEGFIEIRVGEFRLYHSLDDVGKLYDPDVCISGWSFEDEVVEGFQFISGRRVLVTAVPYEAPNLEFDETGYTNVPQNICGRSKVLYTYNIEFIEY